jgi:transglutaminase-like putative cysteine protease
MLSVILLHPMFELSYQMSLTFSQTVREHQFVLRLLPRPDSGIVVHQQQLMVSGKYDENDRFDGFANRLIAGVYSAPHTALQVMLKARVARTKNRENPTGLPASVFLPQSRLTQLNQTLLPKWTEDITHYSDSYELAQALSQRVFNRMLYTTGATHVGHTVNELLVQPFGVCQDYAHVLIALLRHYAIPARYVAGVTQGEGQSHAWVEAWINDSWIGLDPTHDCLVPTNAPYIAFAVGRDFSDCPLNTGSFVGNAQQSMSIQAQLIPM